MCARARDCLRILALLTGLGASAANTIAPWTPPTSTAGIPLLLRQWSLRDGLPKNWVECLHQTQDGYLWIGLRGGIARFDGVRFTRLLDPDTGEPTEAHCKALEEDTHGYLWAATKTGVLRIRGDASRRFTAADGLPDNAATCLHADRRGGVWIGTPGGLCRFIDGRFRRYPNPGAAPPQVLGVLERKDGTVLVAGHAGLHRVDPETGRHTALWQSTRTDPALESGSVFTVMEDSRGRVWFGTQDGVYHGDEGTWRYEPTGQAPEAGRVRCLFEDPSGKIWLVVGERLLSWSGTGLEPAQLGDRFEPSAPNCLTRDAEGNLWIGTRYRGLFSLRSTAVQMLTTREGLPHNEVWSVAAARDGGTWIATADGLCRHREGVIEPAGPLFDVAPGSHGPVYEDADGDLWVGEAYQGIRFYRRTPTGYQSRDLGTASPHAEVQAVFEDSQGRLWTGTRGGVSMSGHRPGERRWLQGKYSVQWIHQDGRHVRFGPNGRLELEGDRVLWVGPEESGVYARGDPLPRALDDLIHELPEGGLTHFDIQALQETPPGTLWFATLGGGLNRLADRRWSALTKSDGLADDRVLALFAEDPGVLWIGTEGGLSRLESGGDLFSYHAVPSLRGLRISQILADDRGFLWLVTADGILRAARSELDAIARGTGSDLHAVALDETTGLISRETAGNRQPAACRTRDGRLWFATAQGVAVVDPQRVRANPTPPQVHIEWVRADGRVFTPAGGDRDDADPRAGTLVGAVNIPPGVGHHLEIAYTATTLSVPEKARFRFRLEGHDGAWIDAATRRVAYYTGLKAGRYRFRVAACNEDGVWNEAGRSLALILRPRFHETPAFLAACLVLATVVVGGAYRARIHRLERRHAGERERTLARERERIARDLHDDVGAELSHVANRIELARHRHQASAIRIDLEKLQSAVTAAKRTLSEVIWITNTRRDTVRELIHFAGTYAEEFLEPAGIRCRFAGPEGTKDFPVDSETRLAVLKVLKEALSNVARHAAASEVCLTWDFTARQVALEIRDNGRGLAALPSSVDGGAPAAEGGRHGNGLANMRQRLETLHGSFDIHSEPGRGTTLRLSVPLRHDSRCAR